MTEFAAKYGIPAQAVLGGPETMYPEYRQKLKGMPIPPKVPVPRLPGKVTPSNMRHMLKNSIWRPRPPRLALTAWANSAQAPDNDIHILKVQGNVYMLVGPGGNTTVQVGPNGVSWLSTRKPRT